MVTLVDVVAARRAPRRPRGCAHRAGDLPRDVAQAPLGAVTVLLPTSTRWFVGSHFLLSLVVLPVGVRRRARACGHDRCAVAVPRAGVLAAVALAASCLALVVTGTFATAAGPHSGSADVPAARPFLAGRVAARARDGGVRRSRSLVVLGCALPPPALAARLPAVGLGCSRCWSCRCSSARSSTGRSCRGASCSSTSTLAAAVWAATVAFVRCSGGPSRPQVDGRVTDPKADELRVDSRPELRRPVLVASFRGWNDGGHGASLAGGFLAKHVERRAVRRHRPGDASSTSVDAAAGLARRGPMRRIDWPENAFYQAHLTAPAATPCSCSASSRACAGARSARS